MREHAALALYSGGLDSTLAVLHMQRLGYTVQPVFFQSYFFSPERAKRAAAAAGFTIHVHNFSELHLQMLQNPRYGYGKNLNPCIDCHGLMFHEAGLIMADLGCDFIISGEVLGQRPMSQRRDAMNSVGKLSNVKDLLVRPLSQKLLSDTMPLRGGWVEKAQMLDIHGRSRKRQLDLVKEYGLADYTAPGGGCLLTDVGFSRRMLDLLKHNMAHPVFIENLKYGRHFRISPEVKLIVGRTINENQHMTEMLTDELVIKTKDITGPLGIVNSLRPPTPDEIRLAASIVAKYNNRVIGEAEMEYGLKFNLINNVTVTKLDENSLEQYRI